MKSLEEALDCNDEDIILEGFMNRYDVSKEEAQEIFHETKKWLWLAALSDKEKNHNMFIDEPLLIIDEMWHTFILYTRSYYNFCINKFNKILHHQPNSKIKGSKIVTELPSQKELKLRKQFNLIYDYLGPDTLVKWYETMPQRYTSEYIRSIRK